MGSITITANEANQRLDRFLRKYFKDMPLSEIYKLMRKKAVKVNGHKAQENYRLAEGDVLEIHFLVSEKKAVPVKEAGTDFSIVYEDDNILLVDKPPELIIHPDIKHKENTLVDQVLYYLYKNGKYDPESQKTFKPAAVNRLDLNTGGIVMFAKNYESLQNLNEMVRMRMIEKYYLCIVKGSMEKDTEIKAYLIKDQEKNIVKISYDREEDSKEIHTKIRVIKNAGKYTLLEINLITGRSHQIRAQLSNMGHPLIGDRKYGDPRENKYFRDVFKLSNQFLYAYKISFDKTLGNLKYLEGLQYTVKLPYAYDLIAQKIFNMKLEQ